MRPVETMEFMRIERKSGDLHEGEIIPDNFRERTRRMTQVLVKPCYRVKFHFESNPAFISDPEKSNNPPQKPYDMFKRRIRNGNYYRNPYFGCKEFPVSIRQITEIEYESSPIPVEFNEIEDPGVMLYDFDYSGSYKVPMYYHPLMRKGRIKVPKIGERDELGRECVVRCATV